MGETGDILKEFKSAKPPEKAVIIGGVAAVVGIGIYLYIKNKNSAGATAATPTTGTSSNGQVAGFPSVGASGTPVLPSGTNPLFDPNGNLIAFQNQPPGTTPTPTPTPTPDPTATNWFQQAFGSAPEISQQNGQFLLVQRGANNQITSNINLRTLFPSGTTFSGAGSGQAFASIPGQDPLLLTNGGYGRPMTASRTVVAKTAAKK